MCNSKSSYISPLPLKLSPMNYPFILKSPIIEGPLPLAIEEPYINVFYPLKLRSPINVFHPLKLRSPI